MTGLPAWTAVLPLRVTRQLTLDPLTRDIVWGGAVSDSGYGTIRAGGRTELIHRYVYAEVVGDIPPGYQIDHVVKKGCRSTLCVNAAEHLEAVLPIVNTLRGNSPAGLNARKFRCTRGHLLAGPNLYRTPDGRRQCKACVPIRLGLVPDVPLTLAGIQEQLFAA